MRCLAVVVASAVLFASVPASVAAVEPAVGAACSAPGRAPGASEADYRCVFPSGWSQPYAGAWHLRVQGPIWEEVAYASGRYQFTDGRLRRIDFVWQGDFGTIEAKLRGRRGPAQDSSWDGQTFLTYPDIGDGWQVTLSGPPGGSQFSVTYIDRTTLWN